jgi:hypothetical protein
VAAQAKLQITYTYLPMQKVTCRHREQCLCAVE